MLLQSSRFLQIGFAGWQVCIGVNLCTFAREIVSTVYTYVERSFVWIIALLCMCTVCVCVFWALSYFLIRCSLPQGSPRALSQAYWIYHCLMSTTHTRHVPTIDASVCKCVCVRDAWELVSMVLAKERRSCEKLVGCTHATSRATDAVPLSEDAQLCTFCFPGYSSVCVSECVMVCVGVRGRECSHETSPNGTDNTAVLS